MMKPQVILSEALVDSYGSEGDLVTLPRELVGAIVEKLDDLEGDLANTEDWEGMYDSSQNEVGDLEYRVEDLEYEVKDLRSEIEEQQVRIEELLSQLGDCRDYILGND